MLFKFQLQKVKNDCLGTGLISVTATISGAFKNLLVMF